MSAHDDARVALAQAVTDGGVTCLAYPPDNPSPPIAFVDDLGIDFSGGGLLAGSFCRPGLAAATIVTTALAHDREGSTKYLEGLIDPILDELIQLPGLRLVTTSSGQLTLGGQEVPAVTYTVQFPI